MGTPRGYIAAVGVIIAAVTLAFYQVLPRPPALSGEISASRILEVALVGAAFLLSLRLGGRAGRQMPFAGIAGFATVMAFSAWALLSAFWSPLPLTATVKALELAALAVAAYRIAATAPHASTIAISGAGAAAMMVVVLILMAMNVVYWGTPIHFDYDDLEMDPFATNVRIRLMLGYNHALSSAVLLAAAIVFVVNSSCGLLLKAVGCAALGALLWLCDARGVTTALPISLVLCAFLRARPSMLGAWGALAVGFVGVGSAVILLPYTDIPGLLSGLFGEDVTSLNSRTHLWVYVLDLALQHPLAGVGYFGARAQLLSAFPFAGHAHNGFLETLLTTGLPGATLFVTFTILGLVRLFRTRDPLLGGLFPIVLIEGNLNPVLFTPTLPMFLFMIALFGARAMPRRRHPSWIAERYLVPGALRSPPLLAPGRQAGMRPVA